MLQKNIPLSIHNSYKIGGTAQYFSQIDQVEDIPEAVHEAESLRLPIFILGGGTNILFRDSGFNGTVLKISANKISKNGNTIIADSGISMDELLNFAAENNSLGLEWAGGLPGTLGGAVRGNAGCFGGEIKDVVKNVTSFDIEANRFVTRTNEECKFGYRTSIFKTIADDEIITRVLMQTADGEKSEIHAKTKEKIEYRQKKHPTDYPNIGSIFKNVYFDEIPNEHRDVFAHAIKSDPSPVIPAAAIISQAGFKGVSYGGAMISPKHPNFIVNVLNADAHDVHQLIRLIKNDILSKFNISLEEEVNIL